MAWGKRKGQAPECDDQAFRRSDIFRKFLELCGLYNKITADDLLDESQTLDPIWRENPDNIDAQYEGDKIVRFVEVGTGVDYKVTDSFSQVSTIPGVGREEYCVIQQSQDPRYFSLLRYDKAADIWRVIMPVFFTEKFTIIKGGIKYHITNSCRPIINDKLRKK